MNILFITQYFPPEIGAAPERAYEFARYFKERGHQVQVITGFPNHPSGIIHQGYRSKLTSKECYKGIDILRTYTFATPNKTLINRFLNFLSFSFSSLLGLFFIKKPEVILLTIPPLFLGATGIIYRFITRKPLVLDVRDLWPRAAVELGEMKESIVIKILTKMELYFYKKANRITVVTEGIKNDLIHRGVPREKINLITNGVNTEIFNKVTDIQNPYKSFGLDNKFIVVYSGVIGIQHGVTYIAKAASILSREKDIAFVFIGDGVKKNELKKEAEKCGLDNIHFLQNQPVEFLVEFLSYSHIGLATLRNLPFCNGIILVKIFCYMSCMLPVILAGYGESKDIVVKSKAGLCIEPENPEQLAEAINVLYKSPEKCNQFRINGRNHVEKYYSRRSIAGKMEEMLKNIA